MTAGILCLNKRPAVFVSDESCSKKNPQKECTECRDRKTVF